MTLGNVLCLLTGVLLALLWLAWAVRRGLRPMSAASAYRNAAWKLGIEADTRGTCLHGYLDGRRVYVGHEDGAAHRGDTIAVVDLAWPLGLGLRIHRRARFGRHADDPTAVPVADPELDRLVAVRALDPTQAAGLLDETVRGALLEVVEHWPDLRVSDAWIHLRLPRPPAADTDIHRLLDHLQRLAAALEAAREALPLPPDLRDVADDWGRLAARLDLDLHPTLPALSGARRGRGVRVSCLRTREGFRAEVQLQLRPHPDTGLHLSPQAAAEGAWTAGQDIEVGDRAFDDAHVIKGYDPMVVRELIGPQVRAALTDVAAMGALVLTDRALSVGGLPVEARAIDGAITGAERAADALGW
jgi:hypothetical protein